MSIKRTLVFSLVILLLAVGAICFDLWTKKYIYSGLYGIESCKCQCQCKKAE